MLDKWRGDREEIKLMVLIYDLVSFVVEKQNQHRRGGASLVAQWFRICLPMQGTRVRALVQEDPTCRGATKPMRHNY